MKKEGTMKMKKMPKMGNVGAVTVSAPSHMSHNDAAICSAVHDTLSTIDSIVQDANDVILCVGAISNKLASEQFDDPNVKSMLLSDINTYMTKVISEANKPSSEANDLYTDKVYNPTKQTVNSMQMTDWIAMQTVNMYAWLGMPCVVSGIYAKGIVIRTHDITYEYVTRIAEAEEIDFAFFTDGNRVTTLKR